MPRAVGGVGLLVLLILLSDAPPAGAQKIPGAEKDMDKNTEKMVKAGVLVGKILTIFEDKRKIRLQVTVPVTKIDEGQLNAVAQAQQRLAQARLKRDVGAMQQAQRDLVQAQARLCKVENVTRDLDLEARDDVVVRTARPKEDFDDKGRIKRYSAAELKQLKGPDAKAPGYRADFSDVATQQIIQVTLVKKKGAPPRPAPRLRKGKDAEVSDADVLGNNLPQISRILILREAPPSR
jgi:hypothetical protein